jgi:V8-like Glu-specific endopeptidase
LRFHLFGLAGGLAAATMICGIASAEDNQPNSGSGESPVAGAAGGPLSGSATALGPPDADAGELARSLGMAATPSAEARGTLGISRGGETTSSDAPTSAEATADVAPGGDGASDAIQGDRSVFGNDGRERVRDTTVYPFRAVGILQMTNAAGQSFMCTAALIGPKTLLTAAHCLYQGDTQSWYDNFTFAPGANGFDDLPYGSFSWEHVYIMEGYASLWDGDYNSVMAYDIGMVILDQPIGEQLGWLGFEFDPQPREMILNHVGYPFDREPFGTMWRSDCDIGTDQFYDYAIGHRCDSGSGSDGGPLYIYYERENSRMIRGIELYPNEQSNFALRINDYHFDWIMNNRE